ncbi:MAG: family 20 glycosylhydrolase [Puia sp.]|nr:family 20 glycosylhydrolase [Puia sp.]
MLRPLLPFLMLLSISTALFAQKRSSGFDTRKLSLRWELIANNYRKQPQFLSSFTIINTGKTPLPASGWVLYFNDNQEVLANSVTGDMRIEHLNGDIFRLSPLPSFKGIKPKDSIRVEFLTGDIALNASDIPTAPFLVWDAQPKAGIPIRDYTVLPITDTTIGLLTPEILYSRNTESTDIPADRLTKIFPTPASYQENAGEFTATASTQIINTDPAFDREAGWLADQWTAFFGKKAVTAKGDLTGNSMAGGKGSILLQKKDLPDEAYELNVTPEGITIAAGGPAGIFYGIQSLQSLLPPSSWSARQTAIRIPSVTVKDKPRFGFRSLLVDIARNFQTKKEMLKVLDVMALYKLNALHLHFSDDEGWRIEIPSLPELTGVGARRGYTTDSKEFLPASYGDGPDPDHSFGTGYYTRQDFIEILKYARDRHIQVIPEVESPGHARAAVKAMDARYERLIKEGKKEEAEQYLLRDPEDRSIYSSAQMWSDNVICVARPSAYRFLEKVADELIAMYKEAGAPLETIHFGGDEVPAGVWEQSPICQALLKSDARLKNTDDLWYYYFDKLNTMLHNRGLFLSGWEEVAMRKTVLDGNKQMIPNPTLANENIRVHVWNNMIGSGSEDLPYRIANAGYKVVLSCVSNLYFDLAYTKSADEAGYYWGGFLDLDKPFYFIPFDYYKNSTEDRKGNPVDPSYFLGKDRLTDYGKSNIAGIQGLLWAENVRGPERLEYMLLPKLLGLAERAWASDPDWATEKDLQKSKSLYRQAWSGFINRVGKRELPRLDYYSGGFNYRIPSVGASITGEGLLANNQIPGLSIHYTTDGTEPTLQSRTYEAPITGKGIVKLKAFATNGRSGRTLSIKNQ